MRKRCMKIINVEALFDCTGTRSWSNKSSTMQTVCAELQKKKKKKVLMHSYAGVLK